MGEWKKCSDELPSKDGFYYVTNQPNSGISAIFQYDGYGFKEMGIYRPVNFWKDLEFTEQRYFIFATS
jgi:hypothetical protein